MKHIIIIFTYSVILITLLLSTGYSQKDGKDRITETDYSTLWEMEQQQTVPVPKINIKRKETAFRDKSMATGIDAAPAIAYG